MKGSPVADAKRQLAALANLDDHAIDLAEAGLALAALDHPRRDRAHYRALLAEMIATVADLGGRAESAEDRRAALAAALAGRYALVGDDRDDDDLDSASLMQVLDRRRGPAISLGLLWLHLGRRQGWAIEPLAFPCHFLLRLVGADGGRTIFDPFWGGRPLDAAGLRDLLKASTGPAAELEPAFYAAQSNRQVLLRLQSSVKIRYLRHAELRRALEAVETMLLFAPDQIGLWREAGLMHLRQGDLKASIAALEQFVARAPNSPARHRTSVLLQDLREKVT